MALGWQKLSPATQPHFRGQFAMVYDSARQVIVVFGGAHSGTTILGDTWEWNGATWTQVSPVASPSPRYGMGYAYDATNAQTVIFGGITGVNPATSQVQETWVYNGTTWTQKAPAAKPSKRSAPAMGYDDANGNTVLYGGLDNFTPTTLSDTFIWDGTNWTVQAPVTVPPKRTTAGITYDPNQGAAVLYGGIDGATFYGTLYDWTGSDWTLQAPAAPPNGRGGMVWTRANPTITNVLMFDGQASPSGGNETWSWTGSAWTLQSTPTIPSVASSPIAVRYPPTNQTILLGIGGSAPNNVSETWAWGQLAVTYDVTFGRGELTPVQDFPNAGGVGRQFNQGPLSDVVVTWNGTVTLRVRTLDGTPGGTPTISSANLWLDDGR